MPVARASVVALVLAGLLSACGSGSGSSRTQARAGTTDPKAAVARTEVAAIVDHCSTEMAKMDAGLATRPRCTLSELEHRRGTIWTARLSVPPHTPNAVRCVTFDAARYSPGNEVGQVIHACS